MSRIGRKPVPVPDGVKVNIAGSTISIEGPKGSLSRESLPGISLKHDAGKKSIVVEAGNTTEQVRSNHGTMRSHVANMVQGVTEGFRKTLRISGVGYGAKMQGNALVMTLGYSHPVEMAIPAGIKITVPAPEVVNVEGADRQVVGQFAAEIRGKRIVEPYNLKGIKYEDEVVKKKAGKTFVSGA